MSFSAAFVSSFASSLSLFVFSIRCFCNKLFKSIFLPPQPQLPVFCHCISERISHANFPHKIAFLPYYKIYLPSALTLHFKACRRHFFLINMTNNKQIQIALFPEAPFSNTSVHKGIFNPSNARKRIPQLPENALSLHIKQFQLLNERAQGIYVKNNKVSPFL